MAWRAVGDGVWLVQNVHFVHTTGIQGETRVVLGPRNMGEPADVWPGIYRHNKMGPLEPGVGWGGWSGQSEKASCGRGGSLTEVTFQAHPVPPLRRVPRAHSDELGQRWEVIGPRSQSQKAAEQGLEPRRPGFIAQGLPSYESRVQAKGPAHGCLWGESENTVEDEGSMKGTFFQG